MQRRSTPFYRNIEDHYGVLAQYYGTGWLSLRNAVWHGMTKDMDGFKINQLMASDQLHPNTLGHKARREPREGFRQHWWGRPAAHDVQ